MTPPRIKFGKIDRAEPLSIGGTGDMDILARVGGGEWQVVGQVEVVAICTFDGCMSSDDRYAVDTFEAYLYGDEDTVLSVACFRFEAIRGSRRGRVVRICTAAEAKRILKTKITEALIMKSNPNERTD